MSYDLEVRPKARFASGVPRETVASFLVGLTGVVRTNLTSFALDRPSSGVAFSIDIGHQTGEDDEPGAQAPESVNYVAFLVPYPSLDTSGPVAVEMAVQLAEKLDWSVYDLQAEREVSRDSVPDALRLQRSYGEAAQEVLERAVATELSLGELFMQEMWNHNVVSMVACVVAAVIGTGWFLLALDRPRNDFNRYLPWGVAVGAVVLMWIKGFAQAVVRRRRRR